MHLTTKQEALLKRLMSEGRYSSASAAISAGLELLEQELTWKADARQRIAEGLEDLKAGRVADGEKALQDILDKLDRRQRGKRA